MELHWKSKLFKKHIIQSANSRALHQIEQRMLLLTTFNLWLKVFYVFVWSSIYMLPGICLSFLQFQSYLCPEKCSGLLLWCLSPRIWRTVLWKVSYTWCPRLSPAPKDSLFSMSHVCIWNRLFSVHKYMSECSRTYSDLLVTVKKPLIKNLSVILKDKCDIQFHDDYSPVVQCPVPPCLGALLVIMVTLSFPVAAAIRVSAIQAALSMLIVIEQLASASVSKVWQDNCVTSVNQDIFLWKTSVFVGGFKIIYFPGGLWSILVMFVCMIIPWMMSSHILSMKRKRS